MKNSELLATPKNRLGGLDGQRRYILTMALAPMMCPNCGRGCSQVEAHGTGEIDDYPINAADRDYHCPHCTTQLHFCVPIVGDTFWVTERAWLGAEAEQAERAARATGDQA